MSTPGRVAVATGAARGIGLAVARRFLGDGYGIALLDIDTATLARTAAALAPAERVLAIECDVAEPRESAGSTPPASGFPACGPGADSATS